MANVNTGSSILRFLLAGAILTLSVAHAQSSEDKAAPRTKLETFQRQSGSTLIKGYTDIGRIISAPFSGILETRCMEFINATTKQKQTGIVIEITSVTSRGDIVGASRAFIDYDEIDNLLKGIDYVSKANAGVTKHKNFEVKYETRGGFSVTVFNDSESKIISSIDIGSRSVQLPIEKFAEFRSTILQAREKLDSLR